MDIVFFAMMKQGLYIVGGIAAGAAIGTGFSHWLGPAHGAYMRRGFVKTTKEGEKVWTAHTFAIKLVRGENDSKAFAKTLQELADHNKIVICPCCMSSDDELVHPSAKTIVKQ